MAFEIEKSSWWERVHIVLVEPGESLNVGSVARAMDNLGFQHLHLVAPPRYDVERATLTACWAAPLLTRAEHHESLGDALASMTDVIGFSTRGGKNRPPLVDLPAWREALRADPPERLALVFGPEDTGLTQEHVAHCRLLVKIPTRAVNPAFNLAQAVLVVLYELTRCEGFAAPQRARATWAEFGHLDQMVDEIARATEFYHTGTPADLPELIRNLFRRTGASPREAQILLGFFGRILKSLPPTKRAG